MRVNSVLEMVTDDVGRPLWSEVGRAFAIKVGSAHDQREARSGICPRASSMMLNGRCECRAVRYRVADEFLYAANCHCSNCRAGTGSAFKPFAGIEREKLSVVEGADRLLVWGDDTAESHEVRRLRVPPVTRSVRDGAYVHVLRWALSRTSPSIRPTEHIFVGSKADRGSRSRTTCLSRRSTRGRRPTSVTLARRGPSLNEAQCGLRLSVLPALHAW